MMRETHGRLFQSVIHFVMSGVLASLVFRSFFAGSGTLGAANRVRSSRSRRLAGWRGRWID